MTTSFQTPVTGPSPPAGHRSQGGSPNRLRRKKNSNADLKWGIWAYFLLLIFEGALRKWLLPGLATPLLIIRDPIALWLVVMAYCRGFLPLNGYILGMGAIGIVGTTTAILFGHGSAPVALFGARILLIHFPLVFVIGRLLDRQDIIRFGKITLWITIFMAVLIGLQFYSPQSAWVNRGVGGDVEGAGFSGAMGYSRPPGTFSFTNGATLFFGFASCFILYFWLEPKNAPKKWLLMLASAGLLIAIPLSISRSLFFQVSIGVIFAGVAIARRPQYLGKMIGACVGIAIAFILLSFTPAFQTATEVMGARFESASQSEGGLEGTLVNRFLGGLVSAVLDAPNQQFFGLGLGLGTNVGAMFTSGDRGFLVAEGEWWRIVGELGPLLGLLVIGLRAALTIKLSFLSYGNMTHGNLLPWMLLSMGILNISQGGWAQPTALGFFVIIGGFLMASLKMPKKRQTLT